MDFPFVKEAISQLFSKSSCAMYPAVPSEAAPHYRGRIVYHPDRCIACGMCERVCAGGAISRTVEKTEEGDKVTMTFNLGSCTFCATCADFCSSHSIEFTGDYHMVATKEEDLLVSGSFIKAPRKKPAAPAAPAKAEILHESDPLFSVVAPHGAGVDGGGNPNSVVGLTIHEGKKHQVKKMLMAIGHRVLRLHRDAFGPLTLTGVQEGRWRELNES